MSQNAAGFKRLHRIEKIVQDSKGIKFLLLLEKLGTSESRRDSRECQCFKFLGNANSFVVSPIVQQKIKQLIGIGCRKIMSGIRKMGPIEQRMEHGP